MRATRRRRALRGRGRANVAGAARGAARGRLDRLAAVAAAIGRSVPPRCCGSAASTSSPICPASARTCTTICRSAPSIRCATRARSIGARGLGSAEPRWLSSTRCCARVRSRCRRRSSARSRKSDPSAAVGQHRVARAAVVARQVRRAAARVRRDHAVGLQSAADEPRPRAHQESPTPPRTRPSR